MKIFYSKIVLVALVLIGLQISGCQDQSSTYHLIHPAHVEPIEGSPFNKLELTEKAIERIDIKTAEVTEETIGTNDQQVKKTVPYSSLIYSPLGDVWVYTNPEPAVYVRHEVKVESIQKDKAIITEGPPTGTKVVSQGAAELYGTEYEVGH